MGGMNEWVGIRVCMMDAWMRGWVGGRKTLEVMVDEAGSGGLEVVRVKGAHVVYTNFNLLVRTCSSTYVKYKLHTRYTYPRT